MSPSTIHDVRCIYKIASIPADGIGPEVISAGIQVLQKLASVLGKFEFHFDHLEWSSDYYKKHGKYIPDGGLESLKSFNAILFGSVGAPGLSTSQFLYQIALARLIMDYRRSRPHLPLGPSSSNLSASPTIRQRPPHKSPPWHLFPTQELPSGRFRLGHCARKYRRRIRRPRRAYAYWSSMGSSHRSCNLHQARRGEAYEVCV